MKKQFFTVLLMVVSLLTFGQTYQVSVSGSVEDMDSGQPIPGQMVNLNTDSIAGDFFYYNTVFTNEGGFFADVFEVPVGVSGDLMVSTPGCQGTMLIETVPFSENNSEFTFVFVSCVDPAGGGDSCQAMFDYYPADNSLTTIQFMDASWGDPDTWNWNFGNGATSAEQNPLHTYADIGEYMVSLTITSDSANCSSTIELPVTVGDSIGFPDSCLAMFYSYPNAEDFHVVYFMDLSVGNGMDPPDNWFWEFGDGTTSTQQNPVHTYSDEGTYEVCLTISTDDGVCENTFCDLIEVSNGSGDCQAQFDYYPANDSVPAGGDYAMQFVDMSYGNPTNWTWSFGDGTGSDEQNPLHVYNGNGIYEVCLTIANQTDSCLSTLCREVLVGNDSVSDCPSWFEYEVNDLTASFQAYLNNSQEGQFTWDFGDGTSGSGANISHTYPSGGMYHVTLWAADSASDCYSTYTELLWIGENNTFSISGQVYLADSMFADAGDVYLMTFDTIGQELVNVGQITIGDNGYYSFEASGLPNCIYFVQAELSESSAYYGDYLPTYHINALHWLDTTPVDPLNNYPADVYMIAAEENAPSGDGSISGTVTNEDGKSALKDVEMLLFNADGNALTYVLSNAEGSFNFSQLAYGTYIVYTELVGIETTPVTLTLDANNPDAHIHIVVANGEALLGFDEPQDVYVNEIGYVYPNPATKDVWLQVNMRVNAPLKIRVANSYGQQLLQREVQASSGDQRIQLNTGSLPNGIYFISIQSDDGVVYVQKLLKQ